MHGIPSSFDYIAVFRDGQVSAVSIGFNQINIYFDNGARIELFEPVQLIHNGASHRINDFQHDGSKLTALLGHIVLRASRKSETILELEFDSSLSLALFDSAESGESFVIGWHGGALAV